MTTAASYIVVRRAGEGWGAFKVIVDQGRIQAHLVYRAAARGEAFRRARDAAAIWQIPLMGRDGLEPVAASEVAF